MIREISALLYKELRVEWRQRHGLSGLLLFGFVTVFMAGLAYHEAPPAKAWVITLWLILYFGAANAAGRSFGAETDGQLLYLYGLASAQALIIARMIYSVILLLLITGLCAAFYVFLLGNPLSQPLYFILTLGLGAVALGTGLTLISAIAAKAGNSAGLTAILGFPVLLPQLLTLIRLTEANFYGKSLPGDYYFLVGMIGISAVLSYILFPFLWRE